MTDVVQEMRLFPGVGERLYLNQEERQRFLSAAMEESRENRLFCSVLHYTGCRPSEALALRAGDISIAESAIVFKTLKKRKFDQQGEAPSISLYTRTKTSG